jgi:hypothetical protein
LDSDEEEEIAESKIIKTAAAIRNKLDPDDEHLDDLPGVSFPAPTIPIKGRLNGITALVQNALRSIGV